MARDRSDGGGFICVWRSFRKHQHYFANERRKATNQDAHLDLWLSASYADEDIFSQGETVHIERGQILTAVIALAERWRWSRTRVERFLTAAELRGELVQKRGNRRTILTICNYDKWQNVRSLNESPAEQLTSSRKAPEKHVEQSEPSEPAKPTNQRNGSVRRFEDFPSNGNGHDGTPPGTYVSQIPTLKRMMSIVQKRWEVPWVAPDTQANEVASLIRAGATTDRILEVWAFYVNTIHDPAKINVHWFVANYNQHQAKEARNG